MAAEPAVHSHATVGGSRSARSRNLKLTGRADDLRGLGRIVDAGELDHDLVGTLGATFGEDTPICRRARR